MVSKHELETVTFQVEVPGLVNSSLEPAGANTWEDNLEAGPSILVEPDLPFHPREDLVSCPCGLQLPLEALIEHMQSTGHAGVVSFGKVRAGKIWDLEQAIIEGTSPDCYKCGKPVAGLKRVGRTIYVSHLGCIEAAVRGGRKGRMRPTPRPKGTSGTSSRSRRIARRKRCPICWRLAQKRGSTEALSSTGRVLRFHDNCLEPYP